MGNEITVFDLLVRAGWGNRPTNYDSVEYRRWVLFCDAAENANVDAPPNTKEWHTLFTAGIEFLVCNASGADLADEFYKLIEE